MKENAKRELIMMIIGMLMIVGGVFYFISNVKLISSFFSPDATWPLWASILCLLPLLAGIVLMIVKPGKWYPRLIALAGAVLVIVMICWHTTLHLRTRWAAWQWITVGVLMVGGLALILITLFSRKKERHEQR